jgi:glycyl-tRNA synthetase beta chain
MMIFGLSSANIIVSNWGTSQLSAAKRVVSEIDENLDLSIAQELREAITEAFIKLSDEERDLYLEWALATGVALMNFTATRLEVALRDKGARHDVLSAIFGLGNQDDFVLVIRRLNALQSFLKTDEGANLLAGYKRGANILKAEEKKDKTTFDGAPDAKLLSLPEEKALAEALVQAETSIAADVKAEKFVEAMGVMAKLRAPVDAFFDKVKVNDADPKVRENRLKLLSRLRATLHQVADFSKIEG